MGSFPQLTSPGVVHAGIRFSHLTAQQGLSDLLGAPKGLLIQEHGCRAMRRPLAQFLNYTTTQPRTSPHLSAVA